MEIEDKAKETSGGDMEEGMDKNYETIENKIAKDIQVKAEACENSIANKKILVIVNENGNERSDEIQKGAEVSEAIETSGWGTEKAMDERDETIKDDSTGETNVKAEIHENSSDRYDEIMVITKVILMLKDIMRREGIPTPRKNGQKGK